MPRIFISYRRADTEQVAGRIDDRLVNEFRRRNVFKDSYSIKPGDDFRVKIRDEIAKCNVLLVLIGPGWLNIRDKDTGERRLDDPEDWVRIEIESGLQQKGTRVIPLLIDGAQMPSQDDLPLPLKELPNRQYRKLRSKDPDIKQDMDVLVRFLKQKSFLRQLIPFIISMIIILLIGYVLVKEFMPEQANEPIEETLNAEPVRLDMAYQFLIDVSENMAEPFGDITRYDAVIQTIDDIISVPGAKFNSWMMLRTMGGGIDNDCAMSERVSLQRGDELRYSNDIFIEPLNDIIPSGNTAYQHGFGQVFYDFEEIQADSLIVFAIIGSDTPSNNCVDEDSIFDYLEDAQGFYQEQGINFVLCAFTVFEEQQEADEFSDELNLLGIDCQGNASSEDELPQLVDLASERIEDVRRGNRPNISQPPTPTNTLTTTPFPTFTSTFTAEPFFEVRGGPGQSFDVIATLPFDSNFNPLVVSIDQNWLQIEMDNGDLGWISISGEGRNLVDGIENVPVITATFATQMPTDLSLPTATDTSIPTATDTPLPTPTNSSENRDESLCIGNEVNERIILDEMNRLRIENGPVVLVPNETLREVACFHARSLASSSEFGNVYMREETDLSDWLSEAGYRGYPNGTDSGYRASADIFVNISDLSPIDLMREWEADIASYPSYFNQRFGDDRQPYYKQQYREVGIAHVYDASNGLSYYVVVFGAEPNSFPIGVIEPDALNVVITDGQSISSTDIIISVAREIHETIPTNFNEINRMRVSELPLPDTISNPCTNQDLLDSRELDFYDPRYNFTLGTSYGEKNLVY